MQTGFQSLRSGGRCVIYVGRSLLILFLVLPELRNTSLLALQSAPALQSQRSDTKIEGRVCNASGEAIAEASVGLVNDMQETVADAETGGDGRFILTVPQPGAFVLEVKRDGFRPVRMELTDPSVPSNQRLNVVMEKLPTTEAGGTGKAMEYSDQPNFTIAGVTDWSTAGVHGSTVNARTSESLAQETAALKSSSAGSGADATNEAVAHR